MAAERFAGGRGTAFDTHTRVSAKPYRTCALAQTSGRERTWMLTSISACHEEHGHVAASDRERRDPDDVPYDDAPPWHTNVEEALSGAV